LALLLGYLGSIQFARRAHGQILLDYVAPAEYLLHIINMPAALVVSATTRNVMFQIGLEHSAWVFSLYVLLIGLLWHLIGLSFSRPGDNEAGGTTRIFYDILLSSYCIACIILTGIPLLMPVSHLFLAAAFAWDAALIVLTGRRWFQRYLRSRTKIA
jgi:hypothetical protein